MSPNKNYISGRAFEYKRRTHWREQGYEVVRASGSHGAFDLIALRPDYPVVAIQCKRVEDAASGRRLLKEFKDSPPLRASKYFKQVMEVYIKSTREILSVTV